MSGIINYIEDEYGIFGSFCIITTILLLLFLWLFLSILFILPAFAPVAFVAWWAYKYYKAGKNE